MLTTQARSIPCSHPQLPLHIFATCTLGLRLHSVSSLIFMRPLLLLFLASHMDTVNIRRESVYSITILMHEIGGLRVSVAVASNRSRGCEACNFGLIFFQIMNAIPYSLLQQSFRTNGQGGSKEFPHDNLPFASYGHLELCGCVYSHTNSSVSQTWFRRG